MSRPLDPAAPDSLTLTLRVTRPLADALDAELARFVAHNPGVSASRGAIARMVLMRALLPTVAVPVEPSSAPSVPVVAPPAPAASPEAPAAPAPEARPKRAPRVVPAAAPKPGVRVETTPENDELRALYVAAIDAKRLTHRGTAKRAGCSEKMMRLWASGERRNLSPPLLTAIKRVIKAQ